MSAGGGVTLAFETDAQGVDAGALKLLGLEGREALSTLYEYELLLEASGGGPPPDLQALLAQACTAVVARDGAEARTSGIVREITLLPTWENAPVRFRVQLVPELWRTTLSHRSRVFQDLNVPQIVAQVLKETGFESGRQFRMALDADDLRAHPLREYTVQYEETDFAFLGRLMEDEGIFYYFTHGAGGAELVIADGNQQLATLQPSPDVEHRSRAGDPPAGEGMQAMSRRLRALPAKLGLREYNWRTPAVPLRTEAPVDTASAFGLHSYYGEHFKTPDEGRQLARVRAEELLAGRDVCEGECTVLGLFPGHQFALHGHPVDDLNRKYICTEVRVSAGDFRGQQETAYRKQLAAIPAEVRFRPARATHRPRISGVMHAMIDGATPGSAAPIDELGRYKVVMPYDLAGEPGAAKASRWIRMAQPSSGAGYGIHFPLHIGVEVLVAHLDGDPDRPIIVGSVPNAETVTPVTSQNPTQSAIRTKAGIHIHFDDDA